MVKKNKGIVLIISIAVMAVVLVLVAAYFSNLLNEKRAAETEKLALQRVNLAEAGAAHALAELNKRINSTTSAVFPYNPLGLKGRVAAETSSSVFRTYFLNNDALGFLRNFAYGVGETQFTVSGGAATLYVANTALYSDNRYRYTAKIIVEQNGAVTNPSADEYVFPYKYRIEYPNLDSNAKVEIPNLPESKGIALLQGEFTVTVHRDNYAKYALFTSDHNTPAGGTVWFTENTNFSGPVHTNERFNFANNPSAHFTDVVTQHETRAGFYNNGNPRLLNADSNPPRDVPTFDAGFQRGVDEIDLPTSVSQTGLKNEAAGNQNDSGWANGIYLPNQDGNLIGGIYVKGNASNLTMAVENEVKPVYIITQGTNTKKVTVDYAANTTTVANISGSGGTPVGEYNGIPDGVSNEGTDSDSKGTVIYSSGSIGNFSGRVQSQTKITVSSNSDIVINPNSSIDSENKIYGIPTGKDIQYQNYDTSPTLNAENYQNLLGVLSWNGDVRIGTSVPNNPSIHGIVMAPSEAANGVFTVDNYDDGSPRGIVTLLGGAITDHYGAFGQFSGTTMVHGYGRNFIYDKRVLQGQTPPYFPYMATFTANITPQESFSSRKLIWEER